MSSHSVDLRNAMAANGGTIIYSTGTFTPTANYSTSPGNPRWGVFVAGPAGATISAITGSLQNLSQIQTVALPAGYIIYDPAITSITLSSGLGFAYYA